MAVPVDDGTHALHDDAVLIGASGEQHTLPQASRLGDRLEAKRGDESSEPSKGAGPLHTTTAVVVTATPPPQTTEFPTLPLPKKRRFFTNEQKDWIRNQSKRDIADPLTDVGSQKYFDELRQRDLADKVLDEGHTSAAMRSYMRTYRDQLQKIAAEEEKSRKRNEKRQAKRDAARSQPSTAEPSQSPLTFIRPTQDQVTALFASCIGRTNPLDTDSIDPSTTGSEQVSVPMVLDDSDCKSSVWPWGHFRVGCVLICKCVPPVFRSVMHPFLSSRPFDPHPTTAHAQHSTRTTTSKHTEQTRDTCQAFTANVAYT